MAKFTWQDGTLVSKAKVEVGGTIYEVVPEEYSGVTPLSASNLNAMQDGIYEDIDNKQLAPDILYSNSAGTTEDIILSKSTDNYEVIEISYKYQINYEKTIKVNIETNKSFTLHDSYVLNNNFIEIFGAYTCSSNTISKIQGQFGYIENGNIFIDGQNYFFITKILGYK